MAATTAHRLVDGKVEDVPVDDLKKGDLLRVGKAGFIKDNGITLPDKLVQEADAWNEQARTVVWIAIDDTAAGILGIADPIKGSSAEAIIKTIILLGYYYRCCPMRNAE